MMLKSYSYLCVQEGSLEVLREPAVCGDQGGTQVGSMQGELLKCIVSVPP